MFVHNHPSGDPTPSKEDLEITSRLRSVGEIMGVRVLDPMIQGFRHKGLKRLFENVESKGVQQDHVEKLENILAVLNGARRPEDMDLPGFRLHPLKGDLKGFWAVTVSGQLARHLPLSR